MWHKFTLWLWRLYGRWHGLFVECPKCHRKTLTTGVRQYGRLGSVKYRVCMNGEQCGYYEMPARELTPCT
jgi:hypothetical protein